MNPRHSLRKVAGLYERELNPWIETALRQVDRVIDVGANDGYFTFGCAAAFKRLQRSGRIVAIEAQEQHIAKLEASLSSQAGDRVPITLVHAYAGRTASPGFITLDDLAPDFERRNTLIKIDVEGAEVDVIEGARQWLHPSNRFVIEVHREEYLDTLKDIFSNAGIQLRQVNQQPLPLLGRECRDIENWWLVTEVSERPDQGS